MNDAQVVLVDGPFPAGTSEIESFRHKLQGMIRKGKKVVLDGGYHTIDPEEIERRRQEFLRQKEISHAKRAADNAA